MNSSTSAIKTVLRRFSLIPSRSKTESRRGSVSVVISPEPEHVDAATSTPCYETSSDSTYDSDSVMGIDTTPNDTPLSWCCRGEINIDTPAEDYKPNQIDSARLLDSHIYVFNFPDSGLDFYCMGDERCTASEWRSFSSRNSTRPRRWSAPHFLQSLSANFSRKAELPTSSLPGCEETVEEDHIWSPKVAAVTALPKKRPTHLNIQVPVMSTAVKARGGGMCVSNKWGNQPPVGYI